MIQSMRKFSNSIFVKILFGALILSFALWGIGDVIRGATSDTSIASVGSMKIPAQIYARDYTNMKRNIERRYKITLSTDQAQKMGLPDRTLQALLNQTALDEVSDRLGLAVGDGQVNAAVHALGFNGPLGTFDRNIFLRAISDSGYSEGDFIAYMRNDIERQQVLSAARNGFVAPPGLTRALYAYARETRAVQYIAVPDSAAGAPPRPSDAELQAFIKAHPQPFSVPSFRSITYAVAGPDDVASQIKVTDDQIAQLYDRRKTDPSYNYAIPEKRDVQQINFKDQASAEAAHNKLVGGTTFDDLAKSLGTKPLDLGSVTQEQLGDRGKAVFALPPDGVTAPVRNLAGFALFHVSKITAGSGKTLAEVKDSIRKDIVAELATAKLSDMGNAYMEANSSGMSISDSAKKVGMRVVHVPAVDAYGHAPDGSAANIPQGPEFLAQLATQEVDVDGDPFQGKDGREYVINVESETPAKIKPLSEVRDQATKLWQADAHRKALAAKADELAREAGSSPDLTMLSSTLKQPVQNSAALLRGKADGALSADLVAKIFSVPPGSVVAGLNAKGDGFIVARVSGVAHPPAAPGDPVYPQFENEVNTDMADSVATGVPAAERDYQTVTVNKKQLDQANGSTNEGT